MFSIFLFVFAFIGAMYEALFKRRIGDFCGRTDISLVIVV